MIIGLTGENCAGKDTLAEHLRKKGFVHLSLSDVIRDALAEEGKPLTRENLVAAGNGLRAKYGRGVLAARLAASIEKGKHYTVVSIRHPAEVEELRKLQDFKLVYVCAGPAVRFSRMKARGREGDPRTYEAFLRLESAEASNKDQSMQQLQTVIKMADKRLENDGDLKTFYDAADHMLSSLSSEFKVSRPTWDQYFMNISKEICTRSNCMKRQVGAVIVRDKRIVSTGYNGTPRGVRNCNEGGCKRCNSFAESGTKLDECICSHAEENSIVQAAYHGISIRGGTLYTTYSPCLNCTKMILNAGLEEVVYNEAYPLSGEPLRLLGEAGIRVRQLKVGQ
ncbi:MAG: deaminase [Candidatus Marsarchaeota archaeon]|nr:deaminase [Candidatus Marsarchaeota archaeon]